MPNQAYDTQTIPFIAKITGDKPLQVKQVNFIINLTKPDGSELEKIEVQENVDSSKFPRAATHNLKKPVPDDLDYYEAKANAWWKSPSGDGGKVEAGETAPVRIWPDEIEIKFTADDATACEKVEFKLVPESGKPTDRTSNDNGLWKARGPKSKFNIEITPPWEILSTVKGTGRLREYKINKKSYTATITAPKPDAKTPKTDTPDPDNPATKLSVYKQYVNLPETNPWDPTCPAGHIVKVEVGVSDPNIAQEGDIIFIQCDFKKQADTVRTSPKVQLSGDNLVEGSLTPINSGKSYTGQVKLETGKTARFNVKLGLGAGDICIIKVGTTDPPGDAELLLQNWRKVDYELLRPEHSGGDKVTDHSNKLDTGLPTDMITPMKKEFDKACIDFDCVENQLYNKKDIATHVSTDSSTSCVLPRDWFDTSETGVVYLAAIDGSSPDPFDIKCDLLQIIDKMVKHGKQKQTFSVIFADYLVLLEKFVISIDVEEEYTDLKPNAPGKWFLPHGIRNFGGVALGKLSVKRVEWKAIEWRDKNSATWNKITDASSTGGAYKDPVTFTSDADIKKMLEMEEASQWEILLTNESGFPGELLNSAGYMEDKHNKDKYLKIAVTVEGVWCRQIGGCALSGKVFMPTFGGDAGGAFLAEIMLHEMGHNMGMTYIGTNEIPDPDKKWGRKTKYDIPGFPPNNYVHAGYYYVEHDHRGCHCVYDADETTRKLAGFKGLTGHCIMFGGGTDKLEFCPDCLKHLRNEDISDIKKEWIMRKIK